MLEFISMGDDMQDSGIQCQKTKDTILKKLQKTQVMFSGDGEAGIPALVPGWWQNAVTGAPGKPEPSAFHVAGMPSALDLVSSQSPDFPHPLLAVSEVLFGNSR